jgi:plasmid stabilization system protein ParE
MKVLWTPEAEETFEQIIDNLILYWTQKELNSFLEQTENVLSFIEQNSCLYKLTQKNKQVRKGFINKLVTVFYRVDSENKQIEILSFWNNRQDPDKNKFD